MNFCGCGLNLSRCELGVSVRPFYINDHRQFSAHLNENRRLHGCRNDQLRVRVRAETILIQNRFRVLLNNTLILNDCVVNNATHTQLYLNDYLLFNFLNEQHYEQLLVVIPS